MGKIANDIASFCTPSRLYLALGLIGLVVQVGLVILAIGQGKLSVTDTALTVVSLGLGLLFILGYSAALNKFCTWGWTPFSWLLVVGPLLAMVAAALAVLNKLF